MDLIVQGADIDTAALKQLARLTDAAGIEQIASGAFRLSSASAYEDLDDFAQANALDVGYVPEDRRLSDFGLFVTDMDSTLISIECIDEIADMAGVKPQVAAITEAAMRGEIDFRESLTRRVAQLAGLEASALERVYAERLRLNPGAERLVARLKQAGLTTVLVSGGFTFFTERLQARLGFDHSLANRLEIDAGRLTGRVIGDIVDATAKRDTLERLAAARGLSREATLAMGDGANDLAMFEAAGLSFAYRAKPRVRETASYAIDHVGLDGVLPLLGAA